MKLRLPNSVTSSQDVTALLIEVETYSHWFAHEAIKQRVDITHESKSPVLSPSATELIRDWTTKKPLNQQSLDALIQILQAYTDKAPSITLTLAAPPTNDIKTTLVAWCRENIAPNILVTFRFNSTLLGGMVVRYGSRVFDWSFKRQILASKERFPEVLHHV